jgi:hypothetical protein
LSNIRTGTISGVNGTDPVTLTKQSAAKAYVRMVGSGTVSITESLNHSSVVDNAVGQYTLNLSSSMSTSTYAVQSHDNNYGGGWSDSLSVSSYNSRRRSEANAYIDTPKFWGLIHGDLA